MTIALSRREFLKVSTALGGGLALEFWFPVASGATGGAAATEVNAWIVIHPDDRVVIRIARSEMGQGTYTALAQLVAEELDCDWATVSAEFASPNEHIRRNRIWGSMSTGGSQGVRSSQDYVRRAGASAREMLIAAAAAQWKVPAEQCKAASRRHYPRVDRPEASLRPGGRRGGKAGTAEGRGAARSRRLEDRRQAAASSRYSRQGAGQAGLRCRRHAARNAACLDRAVSRVRREGGERRRARSACDARREEDRARGRLRRRRRRQLVARQ